VRPFVAARWRPRSFTPIVQCIDNDPAPEPAMNTITRHAAALAMASIVTLSLLAAIAQIADRQVAGDRIAHSAMPAVQQVVVVASRGNQT
jgi:hypothetical protein